ncbi:hypothetical protein [Mycolicibacterium sp. XJ870]
MLPSRPRLERWNPDSLTFTAQSITDGGLAVGNAVTAISDNIKTMPDTKAWSGGAHTAATEMFERAKTQTDSFSTYTTAVAEAFNGGADTIGATRTALLNKADEIDKGGQLHVSDQWVVLIAGGQMTVEEAAALERRAQAEQVTVNGMLFEVGAADEGTAAKVSAAGQPHGFQAPDPTSLDNLFPGMTKPGDDVPNPMTTTGLMQQAILRDGDMSQTIRETRVETRYDPATGEEVATITTTYMLDGSKAVKTVNAQADFSDRGPLTTEVHFDKDGNKVSETTSVTYEDWAGNGLGGAKSTTIQYADGTVVNLREWPDGRKSGTILADDQQADVPINLFDHPIMSSLSAGASAVPGPGGKYGGPGISVATALWDIAVADSNFEKCVATAEGVTSVATGTLAGLATSGATPVVSIPVALFAAGGGEALGNWIGNTFCPR